MGNTAKQGTTPTEGAARIEINDATNTRATKATTEAVAAANGDDANTNESNENESSIMPQLDGNVSIDSISSEESEHDIQVHATNARIPQNRRIQYGHQNLHTVHRSNKLLQTLHLPKLCNINPQSVYNKREEFVTFVEEMETDVIFISESHERPELTLD